ncbi:MAG: hypothetical protein KF708_04170 [Pirellulales bacterium]|nr:hypothetical protein [Pirellulales bacterium]
MADTSLYRFYVTLHARPAEAHAGSKLVLGGQTIQTLDVNPAELRVPCACSFEEATDALSRLPRMYCEPDGSFVWVSPQSEPCWQVDGNLYDRDGRLLFVDLKGTCPAVHFDELLRAFGWPETQVVFQLVREAVFVDEAEFRRLASVA